ncbi:MAG: phage Gp37/Gp68 family protein [Streptomyces sp.]|nr:phage Gp37/Gp68 family protein [Streptomyces sp.]
MTGIQWTDQVWNPSTGCDRISPGCDNCYALSMAKRLKGMEQARGATNPKYQTDGNPKTSGPGFGIAAHAHAILEPLRWKKPRRVFVNSMSDLFHSGIDTPSLHMIFGVMAATPQHTYQILTKRHARMRSLINDPNFAHMAHHRARANYGTPDTAPWTWPLPNVHLGVSVENQKWADIRIPALLDTPAAVRFLSMEPLLGPVTLFPGDHSTHERDFNGTDDYTCLDCSTDDQHVPWRVIDRGNLGIDWVIIGGESGPGARPFDPQWAADLIDDARQAGAAPFVKQLGSVWARDTTYAGKTVAAHGDPKGGKPQYWPARLRVREYPTTRQATDA